MPAKISERDWVDRVTKAGEGRYKFTRWDGKFNYGRSKAVVTCDIDGYQWVATVKNLTVNGTGCPKCSGQARMSADEWVDKVNTVDGLEFVRWEQGYKNNTSRIIVRCLVCKLERSVALVNIVHNRKGCPHCVVNGKTEEQPAPNVTVEIPTDVKPAFDLLNW